LSEEVYYTFDYTPGYSMKGSGWREGIAVWFERNPINKIDEAILLLTN